MHTKTYKCFFLKVQLSHLFSLKAGDDLNLPTFFLNKFQTAAKKRWPFAMATYLVKSTAAQGNVFKTVFILNNVL